MIRLHHLHVDEPWNQAMILICPKLCGIPGILIPTHILE